jgi:hypothetical protein
MMMNSSMRIYKVVVRIATLIDEQQHDLLLAPWMLLGKEGKGNFYFRSGILYHKDTVCGQVVEQLCLPSCRVETVIRMVHDA